MSSYSKAACQGTPEPERTRSRVLNAERTKPERPRSAAQIASGFMGRLASRSPRQVRARLTVPLVASRNPPDSDDDDSAHSPRNGWNPGDFATSRIGGTRHGVADAGALESLQEDDQARPQYKAQNHPRSEYTAKCPYHVRTMPLLVYADRSRMASSPPIGDNRLLVRTPASYRSSPSAPTFTAE